MARELSKALVAAAVVVGALGGCGGETGEVSLHLCPAQTLSFEDLAAIRAARSWELVVWKVSDGDVIWTEEWASETGASGLSRQLEIPLEGATRLTVEGWGTNAMNRPQLVAVGGSEELNLTGGVNVCLCIAPADEFEARCPNRQCAYAGGSCWGR